MNPSFNPNSPRCSQCGTLLSIPLVGHMCVCPVCGRKKYIGGERKYIE